MVVLDVMLPGMDGFHLRRDLRSQGQFVPILMLTARGQAKTCCAVLKRALMIIFRSRLIFRCCWRESMRCCGGVSGFTRIAAAQGCEDFDFDGRRSISKRSSCDRVNRL